MPYELRGAGLVAIIASTFALSGCFGGGSAGTGAAVDAGTGGSGGGTGGTGGGGTGGTGSGTGGTGGGTGGTGGTGGGSGSGTGGDTGGSGSAPTGPIASRVAATYSGDIAASFQHGGGSTGQTNFAGTLTLDVDTDRTTQVQAAATNVTFEDTSENVSGSILGAMTGTGTVNMADGTVGFGVAGDVSPSILPTEVLNINLTGTGTFGGTDASQISGTLGGRVTYPDAAFDEGTGTFLLLRPAP